MLFLTILGWLVAAIVIMAALVLGYFAYATRRIAAGAEKAVPAIGRFVEVGGNRIHYVEKGSGPPILFVHGLGGHLHHFRYPLFDALGDDYRLIALDRAGSGYSTRNGTDAGLAAQAKGIAGFIDALGLDLPLLVGHSLGGAISLATALDYPDKVSGLALLSPLTHHEGEVSPAFAILNIRTPWLRRAVANTVAAPLSVRNAPKVLDFVFGPQKPPADYAVAGGAISGLRPQHIYGTSSDFVGAGAGMPAQQERYGELTMPVGILYGTGDRLLDYQKHGLAMQGKVRGLDLEILDGIGHMPQFVATKEVVAFIRRMAAKAFAGPSTV